MSAAFWGLLGTVVGGLLAMAGNVLVHRLTAVERARFERELAAQRARAERKTAYVRLLTAARRLRYLARPGSTIDPAELDELRTDLSSVNYEITLISPSDMASSANELRRRTMDYLNAAAWPTGSSQSEEATTELRLAARRAVREFIAAARRDLGGEVVGPARGGGSGLPEG